MSGTVTRLASSIAVSMSYTAGVMRDATIETIDLFACVDAFRLFRVSSARKS